MQQSETEASLGSKFSRNHFWTLISTVFRFEPGASFSVGIFKVLQNNVNKKV